LPMLAGNLPATKLLHNKRVFVKYHYFKPISIKIRRQNRFQNVIQPRQLRWKINEAISGLPAIQFIFYSYFAETLYKVNKPVLLYFLLGFVLVSVSQLQEVPSRNLILLVGPS